MKYLSDDGIEFDTEQECLEHEEMLAKVKNSFVLYDENLKVINVEDTLQYNYIHILSNPDEVRDYIYDETGWGDGFNGTGVYKLNENGDWEKLDDLIDNYRQLADSLEVVKIDILQRQANKEVTK